MEFFTKAMVVKLRSHHGKYLIADDDQESVRQSRNSSSRKAQWIIEVVDGNSESIRLKSCHGGYLTATNAPFLLGMTGNKVLQTQPHSLKDFLIEWQPIREGSQVKLRAFGGTYLRANGGTPPWRSSVTHDNPYTSSTYSWILWDVEAADASGNASFTSMASSFSSVSDDLRGSVPGSPASFYSTISSMQKSGMELFHNAKAVRLRSFHDKYLLADEDEESVTQDGNGSSKNARWTVEFGDVVIRLKSCYGKYLTASNYRFLLGMTGRKVLQTDPASCPDSTVEWEPIREGNRVKLRTSSGKFLRANGGVPPWRNSVTHDVPQRTATQDWILWDVHVVEIVLHSPHPQPPPVIPSAPDYPFVSSSPSTHSAHSFGRQESSDSLGSPPRPPPPRPGYDVHTSFGRQESSDSLGSSPRPPPPPPGYDVHTNFGRQESRDNYHYEGNSTPTAAGARGRTIYYGIGDDFGYVSEGLDGFCIQFDGNGVDELTQRIDEELGIGDIIVCSRNPLNGKLYPLLLQLPPNATTMHVVVVQSSSKVAREFAKAGILP